MTNAMIIFWKSIELMQNGAISTTGRVLQVERPDGTVSELPEPETIHTFACWKSLGYSVRKGEKAVARFPIWKGSEKALTDENGNETGETDLRMFLKDSCFFAASQVERTEDKPAADGRKRRRRTLAKPPMVPDLPAVPAPDPGYGSWLS